MTPSFFFSSKKKITIMRLLKYHSPFRKHSSVIYRLGWGFGVFLVSQQNLPDLPHEQIRLAVPSLCSASVECHLRPPSTPSPSPPSSSTPPPPRALLLINTAVDFFSPEGCWLFERSPPCWSCPVVSSWLLVFSFASSQQFFPKLIPKPKKEKTMLRVFPE